MIYYAHSKRIYGSKREEQELDFLRSKFEGVVDPNTDMGELGSIDPYLDVVTEAEALVVSEFQSHIGKGAFSEVQQALEEQKPVHALRKGKKGFELVEVKGLKVVDETDWAVKYGKLVTRNSL